MVVGGRGCEMSRVQVALRLMSGDMRRCIVLGRLFPKRTCGQESRTHRLAFMYLIECDSQIVLLLDSSAREDDAQEQRDECLDGAHDVYSLKDVLIFENGDGRLILSKLEVRGTCGLTGYDEFAADRSVHAHFRKERDL